MRPIWAHGWKRRQTRVMQWSRGGGGLGDASVFVPAEMRDGKMAHMTSRWHEQNTRDAA